MDREAWLRTVREGQARYRASLTPEMIEARRQKRAETSARQLAETERLYWSEKLGRKLTHDEAQAEMTRWAALTRLQKSNETRARARSRAEVQRQHELVIRARRDDRRQAREARAEAAAEAERVRWASLTRAEKSRETRAKNRALKLERRVKAAEAARKAGIRRERVRQDKNQQRDEEALLILGPAPEFVPVYQPPKPVEWESIPPRYLLRFKDFWKNVDRSGGPDACWPWTGNESRVWPDYGSRHWRGMNTGAHRASWEYYYRLDIPDRWVGDHMCGCKWCCSPFHIEPVPFGENVRRNHNRPPEATRVRTSFERRFSWENFDHSPGAPKPIPWI